MFKFLFKSCGMNFYKFILHSSDTPRTVEHWFAWITKHTFLWMWKVIWIWDNLLWKFFFQIWNISTTMTLWQTAQTIALTGLMKHNFMQTYCSSRSFIAQHVKKIARCSTKTFTLPHVDRWQTRHDMAIARVTNATMDVCSVQIILQHVWCTRPQGQCFGNFPYILVEPIFGSTGTATNGQLLAVHYVF